MDGQIDTINSRDLLLLARALVLYVPMPLFEFQIDKFYFTVRKGPFGNNN
jgi:hypothetical protein